MKGNKSFRNIYWLFLAPVLIVLLLVIVFPFIYGIGTSFTNSNGLDMTFIGLENYKALFQDRRFLESLNVTFWFSVVSVVLVNVLGLSLGVLVTSIKGKFATFLRTTFFVPNLIGGVILGFIWQFIFIQAFTAIAEATGIDFFSNWLATSVSGFWALVIVFLWQMGGYVMLIYISFLTSVSPTIIDSAKIDGANAWQVFWYIKFPAVAPAFTISLFLTLTNAFRLYDLNLTLTNGGPFGSTEMLAMNIYNTAFQEYSQGYAQAKGVLFFIIVTIVTVIQLRLTRKREMDA
ncbi:carbohydrate ABC transporter permease [Tetragenococcus koreensis]|uniref:Sugar ABC transporter permease protein n=2 Tax=Enterococcaceae TaxID=81852 RepID=A0AAN4UAS2_9ENTE|nr:sugar ABC transporter permease [Tetragenococcus koreensis]GEQ48925.1 sugar ABC transporter permease protein [Tetragenococcus koreensis]GEQ51458.1 sugar ABC transporter permease protein [Tetragenococcus koreensis]GEQ54042.1 sugar ABC transporter permease protein [Tetragenococcus koreensis]GEQ56460.1 sugar ABC transporter permease protein [Tetragenococcus koreensis]GEQ58976.1 sugar ABC transporter permease protein [Tetragenococcus koreensis]